MPITRREKWAAASLLFLLVLFLLLRRALLVTFLALKILGHSEALDAWKGPVLHRTIEHAGIPIDIYGGEQSSASILIVHGVNPTGKNSLDLVRISEALAQVGYQVFVPDFIEMKKLHLLPEEAVQIKTAFQFIGKDSGIACFSYGCGPALIATADPDIRDRVRFAVVFGGYFDVREALEFVVTGPEAPTAYLKWAYLEANSDVIADEGDRTRLRTIAKNHRDKKPVDAGVTDKLSPEARSLLEIFSASSPEEFRLRLNAGPETVRRRLDALSPSLFFREIRAPLILIHGVNDPVIPVQQTVEFADAARANGMQHSLTLLRLYGHVNPILPDIGVGSVFDFYVPETFRFFRVVNRLIAAL